MPIPVAQKPGAHADQFFTFNPTGLWLVIRNLQVVLSLRQGKLLMGDCFLRRLVVGVFPDEEFVRKRDQLVAVVVLPLLCCGDFPIPTGWSFCALALYLREGHPVRAGMGIDALAQFQRVQMVMNVAVIDLAAFEVFCRTHQVETGF